MSVLHSYPLSSCMCYECTDKEYKFPTTGVPTNLSVKDCKVPEFYDCKPSSVFKNQVEPSCTDKYGHTVINPIVFADNFNDPTFEKIEYPSCPGSVCTGTTWSSMDPRLLNAAGPSRLQLDRKPFNSTQKLNTLYKNKNLDGYGQNYKTYSDVEGGHIVYYINHSREDAFYKPLFGYPTETRGIMYKDPMDNMKPHYERVTSDCSYETNPVTKPGCSYRGCLSWIDDSTEHREDILSKQMSQRNQNRWMPRWTNTSI